MEQSSLIVRIAVIFYTILFLISQLWIFLSDNTFHFHFHPDYQFFSSIIYTLAIVLCTILFSIYSVKSFSWARLLEAEFYKIFCCLKGKEIFIIAIFSGVGEEFFFRGTLQTSLGYVPASLIFGIVHFIPKKTFFPWTLFATIMGFLLGWLYIYSNNLLLPVLAHAAINFINILLINTKKE